MKVSLVILTWNQRDRLKACLGSLMKWCKNSIYQYIVVVNGSVDGTSEMLKNDFPMIEVVDNGRNLGVPAGRNVGLRQSRGEIVLLLDDDTLIQNDFVTPAVSEMSTNGRIGILGPKLVGLDGITQPTARRFPTVRYVLGRGLPRVTPRSYRWDYMDRYLNLSEPVSADWVIGACQFIRADLIKRIGYLNEEYFFGYEDVDYCKRARNADWDIVYDPRISLVHMYQRNSAKRGISLMKFEHIKSIGKYFFKHGLSW